MFRVAFQSSFEHSAVCSLEREKATPCVLVRSSFGKELKCDFGDKAQHIRVSERHCVILDV